MEIEEQRANLVLKKINMRQKLRETLCVTETQFKEVQKAFC